MKTYINTLIERSHSLGLTLVSLFLLYACDSDTSTSVRDNIDTTPAVEKALYSPADSVIPFPNDLLFGTDGTLNIPVTDANDYSDPQVAMNTSWGFATGTSMTTSFSSPIDVSSINGDSVRIYRLNSTAPLTPLSYGTDYVASVSGFDANTLAVVPLRPLNYASRYLVVLTSGLRNTSGTAFAADIVYRLLKPGEPIVDADGNSRTIVVPDPADAARLEALRQATNVHANESAVIAVDSAIDREDIILSWTFTTQPAGPVLAQVRTLALGMTVASNVNTTATTTSPGNAANIHVGTLTVPYYLQAPSVANPVAALTEFWKDADSNFLTPASPIPQKTGDETIPLLLAIPQVAKPPGGWPVVVFQHGITRSRQDMLGAADALAAAGMAVAAIDMPLHGLPTTDPLSVATEAFDNNAQERHFDMDLVNNTTSAPGPDGTPDDSGIHFINLSNLAVTRDNVRQSVADLFALTKALETMNYDDDSTDTDFDISRIYFMGHSLGGIVGSVFVALEPNVQDAVLAMPGASLAKLLDGSATFGPIIAGGLAANGVNKGTADYEAFMLAAQTVVDPADPINYADRTGGNRGVLLFEVVGDLVIPNTVPDINSAAGTVPAPLAGTTPLATTLGLTQYNASASGSDLAAWVLFSTDNDGSAHHGSVLLPTDAAGNTNAVSEAIFFEMQTEFATFLASDGAVLSINDDTYIVAP